MSIKITHFLLAVSLVLLPINTDANDKKLPVSEEELDYNSWIIHKQIMCVEQNITDYCD